MANCIPRIHHSFTHSSFQQIFGNHALCSGHYGSGNTVASQTKSLYSYAHSLVVETDKLVNNKYIFSDSDKYQEEKCSDARKYKFELSVGWGHGLGEDFLKDITFEPRLGWNEGGPRLQTPQ